MILKRTSIKKKKTNCKNIIKYRIFEIVRSFFWFFWFFTRFRGVLPGFLSHSGYVISFFLMELGCELWVLFRGPPIFEKSEGLGLGSGLGSVCV
jgi:hypothetical protein